VICVRIFGFSLSKKEYVKEKKQLVQDVIPPPSLYIQMCSLYTYTNTYMTRLSLSRFFGPSRCLILTPGLRPEYPICALCLCVCVYTHLHPHTLPPALEIEKTPTTPLSLFLSKITPHAKQQVPSYNWRTPSSSFPNAEWTTLNEQTAHTWAHMNSVAIEYANVNADVYNTCLTYTPAQAWSSQHLSKCMHTLRKKCTCTRACAPMQRCRSFFAIKAIANWSWV